MRIVIAPCGTTWGVYTQDADGLGDVALPSISGQPRMAFSSLLCARSGCS